MRSYHALFALSFVGLVGAASFGGCASSKSEDTASPAVSFDEIHAKVLKPSCAFGSCHAGSAPAAGLDFSTPNSCGSLVWGDSCVRTDKTLVVPSSPDDSYLYSKLVGKDLSGGKDKTGPCAPSEGQPTHMPPTQLLDEKTVALVRAWIAIGAPCTAETKPRVNEDAGADSDAPVVQDAGMPVPPQTASFDKTKIPVGDRANLTVKLTASAPAPVGELVQVTVSDDKVVAAPTTIFFDTGVDTVTVEVQGLAPGDATITVSAAMATATAQITVTP